MPCSICKQSGHNSRSCQIKCVKETPVKAKPTQKIDSIQVVKNDIVPIELDCKDLRIKRQENNDKKVLEALLNENTTEKQLKTVSNEKELYRVLQSAQITF